MTDNTRDSYGAPSRIGAQGDTADPTARLPLSSDAHEAPTPRTPPSVPNTGWSPLGATPAAPPTRPAASATSAGVPNRGPQYLPPVAPPGTGPAPTEGSSPPSGGSKWGWRAAFSFLAGGLIAAGGFAAAQLEPSPTAETATLPAVVETSTATPAPTAPPSTGGPPTVPLVPPDVEEPAAFVAETLGPAVVQITTDFGVGSGVIYDDGLILTNSHVIQGAQIVHVTLFDGRTLDGEIVGTDAGVDIGVVSVGAGRGLPVAPLATGEKAQVGQVAIAIGSPFQLQQSVTAGIVSAVDRPIPNNLQTNTVVAMIQTDAPINPGNSGGALADRRGRVIGLNTSIQTDGTPGNVGVGFAIPIDTAVRVADLLVAGEPIEPGFLGVSGRPPESGEAGVEITEVTAGSAAEEAGLQVGDRVLSVDGAPVTQLAELAGLVVANQAGDKVTLELVRDGQRLEIEATLGSRDGN